MNEIVLCKMACACAACLFGSAASVFWPPSLLGCGGRSVLMVLSFVLRSLERGTPTMIQIHDSSMVLDLPQHQCRAFCGLALQNAGSPYNRLGRRKLSAIQTRGMWTSPTSVTRHQGHSLLARQFQQLPKHVQLEVISKAAAGPRSSAKRSSRLWLSPASRTDQ